MRKRTTEIMCRMKQYVVPGILMIIIILGLTLTSQAQVFNIDPNLPPTVTLPPEEAARLEVLLGTEFPALQSEISPDDKTVVAYVPGAGLAFFNLESHNITPIGPEIFNYQWITGFSWYNAYKVVVVGADAAGAFHRITIKRRTGLVNAKPLNLQGVPLSLSSRGKKLLVGRSIAAAAEEGDAEQRAQARAMPFETINARPGFKRPGPTVFDMEELMEMPVTTGNVRLVVLDFETGEEKVLLDVPEDTTFPGIAWSPDDQSIAMVRWIRQDNQRGGGIPDDGPSMLDSLGNLSPAENPFLSRNSLDLFYLSGNSPQHMEIRPNPADGEVFLRALWGPTGNVVMTQMWTHGTLEGRLFPTYANTNGSTYRFYTPWGCLMHKLAKPDVDALYSTPVFISPSEVIINSSDQLTFGLYHYNLLDRQLRRLPTPNGSIYQIRATRTHRKVVYNYSSFHQPYELFTMTPEWTGHKALTEFNAAAANASNIRADKVSFSLANGVERWGYLIQPADAAFPPQNTPMVVWQMGGPTAPMTEEWGGRVESPFNLLPNFNIPVLMVPLPGRDGFGPEFLDKLADNRNFGQVDIGEQTEIVDQLIGQGVTARDRVGITGCSYGGYFTSQSVTSYPDAYAAANTQCTLIDLFDEWEFGYKSYLTYLMGRTPIEDWDEYFKDSPLQRADMVRTPTLIFSGSDDFLPAAFSLDFHDKVNSVGTPADYYEFAGEGHGLREFNSQFVAAQAQLEWFRKYLKQ